MILLNVWPKGSYKTIILVNTILAHKNIDHNIGIITSIDNIHNYKFISSNRIITHMDQMSRFRGYKIDTLIIDNVGSVGLYDGEEYTIYENVLRNCNSLLYYLHCKNIIIFDTFDKVPKDCFALSENFRRSITDEIIVNNIQSSHTRYNIFQNTNLMQQPKKYCYYIDDIINKISLDLLPEEMGILNDRVYEYNIQAAKKSNIYYELKLCKII
jgi:hypothetical protein